MNKSLQVSFFLTDPTKRKRRSPRAPSFQTYKKVASASGGQAIEVSKGQLPQATAIILDTSTSALVCLCIMDWFSDTTAIGLLLTHQCQK